MFCQNPREYSGHLAGGDHTPIPEQTTLARGGGTLADQVTCSPREQREQRRQVSPTSTMDLKKLILLVGAVHKGILLRQDIYSWKHILKNKQILPETKNKALWRYGYSLKLLPIPCVKMPNTQKKNSLRLSSHLFWISLSQGPFKVLYNVDARSILLYLLHTRQKRTKILIVISY